MNIWLAVGVISLIVIAIGYFLHPLAYFGLIGIVGGLCGSREESMWA